MSDTENNKPEGTDNKEEKGNKSGLALGLLAAGAVGLAAIFYANSGGAPEDTPEESKDFLQTFANEAAGSVEEYDTVAAACTPALAAAINTTLQPLPYQVSLNMSESDTDCDVNVVDTETGMENSWLIDPDVIEGKSSTDLAADIVSEVRSWSTLEVFCAHFNQAVTPKLGEIGVSGVIYGELHGYGKTNSDLDDEVGVHSCVIKRKDDASDLSSTSLMLLDPGYFNSYEGELLFPEWIVGKILDELPIADRRLIADKLPGLLAPQTPQP